MFRLLVIIALCSVPCFAVEVHKITIADTTRLVQDGRGNLRSQFYNPSPSEPFGQPNSHHPWLNPGGVPGNQKWLGVAKVISYEIPGEIKSWNGRGYLPRNFGAPNRLKRFEFPVGTVAKVSLFNAGHKFTTHVSTKVKDGVGIGNWEGSEETFDPVPKWYHPPANCTDCHSDVAKHGQLVHPEKREYYGFVRGSDGRFTAREAHEVLAQKLRQITKELKQELR